MQIGAVWCNLLQIGACFVQLGAHWCSLVQIVAVSSMLVQIDVVWRRLVQFAAHWCSLVHVCAV